jgi:cytochrome c
MWNHLSQKYQIANKVVFLLPHKILNHYNCTNCQKVTGAKKDGSGNFPISNFFETITGY